MATKADKHPDNATGAWYTDTQCIDCDLCRQTAPENFARNEAGGYSRVVKQPSNEEEQARCMEALDACPVQAIGNDG